MEANRELSFGPANDETVARIACRSRDELASELQAHFDKHVMADLIRLSSLALREERFGDWLSAAPSKPTGLLIFLREIPTRPSDPSSPFWGELEDGLERHFPDKPVGIAWGMKDTPFTPAVLDELWLGTLAHAAVTRVPDAGHSSKRMPTSG